MLKYPDLLFVSIVSNTRFRKVRFDTTGKVENLHGHVNFNLQYVNLDLHSL